jgi:hypothetical protein
MLTPEQEKIIVNNISKMETVEEVFNYLSNTFDLKNTKVNSFLVGGEFKKGIIKAIKFLNPPLK